MAKSADGDLIIKTQIDNSEIKKGTKQTEKEVKTSTKNISKEYEKVDKSADKAAKGIDEVGKVAKKIDSAEVEKLNKKLDNTNAQIEIQKNKLNELKAEYQRVSLALGSESPQALAIQEKILKAEQAMGRLVETSDKTAIKLREIDRQAIEAASGGVNKLKERIGETSQESKDLGNIAKDVFRAFGINADEAIDSSMEAWNKYKDTVKDVQTDSGVKLEIMAGAIAGALVPAIGTIIEKILELGGKLADLAIQAENTGARMQVALGLTEEEAVAAQHSIDALNSTGIFEKGEAENDLTTVMRLFDATGERAEALTLKIGATAKGTRADFNEIAYAASTVERTFKDTGITADQVLDLVLGGLQTGKFESGDFLDSLKEYAPAYERLGYSAQQMISSFVSGVEAGAVSADKVGDSIKEFYNKASSGTPEFRDALKQLGMNADQVIARISEGGPRAQQEYQRITQKVTSLSNETKQAQIASVLFGTQWEDTSTEIVAAAAQASAQIGNVTGKTNEAVNIMTSTTSSKIDGFWKTIGAGFREGFAGIGDILHGNFQGYFDRVDKMNDVWSKKIINASKGNGKKIAVNQAQGLTEGTPKIIEAAQQEYKTIEQAFINGEQGVTKEMVWQAEERLRVAKENFQNIGGSIPEALGSGVEQNKRSFLDSIGDLIKSAQNKWKGLLISINSKGPKGYALGTPYAESGTYAVGERGIELVQDKRGNARLLGVNGPELATLTEGARVYNAHATKNILERSLSAFDFDSAKIGRIAKAQAIHNVANHSKSFSEVVNYQFGPGSVTIDAHNIKEFNDVIAAVQNSPNVYSTQSQRKGYTGE